MREYLLMAVAGGLLINTLSLDKKHDVFYKADMKYHEKHGCVNVKPNCKKSGCVYTNEV